MIIFNSIPLILKDINQYLFIIVAWIESANKFSMMVADSILSNSNHLLINQGKSANFIGGIPNA